MFSELFSQSYRPPSNYGELLGANLCTLVDKMRNSDIFNRHYRQCCVAMNSIIECSIVL